ncbi:MAG: Holliday junction branch migration protein RuvA [Oscillospiraceae bacterium]|nr:Holliday junction branch migration protein RuvA [Oscillospiraceae bacterium]
MFHYINGLVAELLPNLAVIDCGGVGFAVNTSAYTVSQLKTGEKAKLYTFVYIREDCMDIYGFASKSEKHCFEMLIGVSGVGPKAAIAILSSSAPENLVMNIVSGNEKALTAAPGIGKKIAQRIILELKDKLAKETAEISFEDVPVFNAVSESGNTKINDASAALMVLGYSSSEIAAALKKVDVEKLSLEEIIKASLKQMIK